MEYYLVFGHAALMIAFSNDFLKTLQHAYKTENFSGRLIRIFNSSRNVPSRHLFFRVMSLLKFLHLKDLFSLVYTYYKHSFPAS